jgi:glycosyltransferase involved in cell wall biosynthesis
MKDYGLEDRIFLHPFTTQIQQYYSQAQVYVLSSRWEGFGLVIVEAMAHGLPVVSSNLPTSKEIMGDTGLYFENGNVKELARRLIEATQLDWPAESAKAIALAQRFHISRIINQWHEIINKS